MKSRQAGAELCQAQVKLQVVVEFGVKVDSPVDSGGWVVNS